MARKNWDEPLKKKSGGTKNCQMIGPVCTPTVQTGLSGPVYLKRSNQKRIKTAAGRKKVEDEAGREVRTESSGRNLIKEFSVLGF